MAVVEKKLFFCFLPGSESRKSSSQDCCIEYFCKTEKKLVMQPAVLVEKVVSPAEESYTGMRNRTLLA